MIKKIGSNEFELKYLDLNQGCRVHIEAKNPFMIFSLYGDDFNNLKNKLEKICDNWVDELGKTTHTHFTLPSFSFTSEDISLTREYSFN